LSIVPPGPVGAFFCNLPAAAGGENGCRLWLLEFQAANDHWLSFEARQPSFLEAGLRRTWHFIQVDTAQQGGAIPAQALSIDQSQAPYEEVSQLR
ncbi:MAG: hypothetical protein J0L89_02280, partial [Xanthomonadales bacterium]|nr:hypothetical protein [Xanthomonadales bacterium]